MTASGEAPTPVDDLAAFVSCLAGFLRPSLDGIAISIAGIVDPVTGAGAVANIPCIDGMDLATLLRARLGLPILVLNEPSALPWPRRGRGLGSGTMRLA